MKKPMLLTLLTTTLLSACVVPTIDSSGIPPISVPVVITTQTPTPNAKSDDNRIYVCKLKAFTKQYRSENTHRGKARLDVKKQCLKEFNEMFCRDDDIQCDEY